MMMGGLDGADAAAAYQTDPNLPVAKTNRYYDQTVDALGGLNLSPGSYCGTGRQLICLA